MNAIQQISSTKFKLKSRGNDITLTKVEGVWAMYTMNAAVRAWNRGMMYPKYFRTLKDVEAKYKSWKGISLLATDGVA